MKQAIGCFFKFLGSAVLSLIFAALIIDGFTLAISFLLEENPSSVKSIRSAFDKKDYKRVTEIYEQDNQGVTNVEIIEKVAISYLLQKEVSESQRLIADYVTNGKNEKEQLDQILEEIEEICDSTEVIEFREYIKFFEQKFPDDPFFILLSGFLEECSGNFQRAFEYFYRVHQSEKKSSKSVLALACLQLKHQNYSEAERHFTEIIESISAEIRFSETQNTADLKEVLAYNRYSKRIPHQLSSIIPSFSIQFGGEGYNTMDEAYYSNLHLIRALCRLKTGQINAALDDLKTTRTNKLQLLFNKGACVYEDYTVTLQRDSLMEECYIAKYNGKIENSESETACDGQ